MHCLMAISDSEPLAHVRWFRVCAAPVCDQRPAPHTRNRVTRQVWVLKCSPLAPRAVRPRCIGTGAITRRQPLAERADYTSRPSPREVSTPRQGNRNRTHLRPVSRSDTGDQKPDELASFSVFLRAAYTA